MIDGDGEPPLFEGTAPEPGRPVLLGGLAAAAVLDGSGEAVALRETRGGQIAWGGVYGQGVRLTSPWHLRFGLDGAVHSLAGTLERLAARRWRLDTRHAVPGLEVAQEVFVLPGEPAVARRLRLTARSDRPLDVRIESEFAPFLAPVLVEGVKPYRYDLRTEGPSLEVRSHGFGLRVESDPLPNRLSVNGAPWIGGRLSGEIGPITAAYEVRVAPSTPASVSWVVWGGLERTIAERPDTGSVGLAAAALGGAAAEAEWRLWTAGTPRLSFPDDPRLEAAYGLARGALRALYTAPDHDLRGLVAGYPWYAALWCRDLAWMLPAVLWLGDAAWYESALRSVFRFQAAAHIPLLGAEAGELPMQLSPGPVFLYGTSDTTLYYPDLLRRLVDHTGDLEAARPFFDHVSRALDWAWAKVEPATGFVRNGGEVLEIRDAAALLSSTRCGFDAVDTTIWDSTDRRDHAVDVQVLYHRALSATGRLLALDGRDREAGDARARASELGRRFRTAYWWPEAGYLYDTLRRDGSAVPRVRPNALRAVGAGLLAPAEEAAMVRRAAAPDLATPWGLRTLAASDPAYDPAAYHDGQVWTIATAWAAEAALAVGDRDGGLGYLHVVADRILGEAGLANECYRGDRPDPFDSCFLLGFSVAPFLTMLFEGLWGIRAQAPERTLRVDPRFPAAWGRAALSGLRFAGGTVDLDWTPQGLRVRWSGPGTLTAVSAGETVRLAGAGEASVPSPPRAQAR